MHCVKYIQVSVEDVEMNVVISPLAMQDPSPPTND